tara:strand:- start:6712 stop:7176 length:465 start_codon:yes stop_codon:yes gene_type:complete
MNDSAVNESNPSDRDNWTTFPITYKYIDISTAHITKEDDEILLACMKDRMSKNLEFRFASYPSEWVIQGVNEQEQNKTGDLFVLPIAPPVYSFDHGYWIWIGLGSEWATLARREGSKFSESFINLYERAVHSDADWMKIDCDGMMYNDLPLYEW